MIEVHSTRTGTINGVIYLGADSIAKQYILAVLPRIASLLSFVGSTTIIIDVLRKPSKRKTFYRQVMLMISILDCIGSVSWFAATLSLPRDYAARHNLVAYGNQETCITQAFFVQLGFSNVFYYFILAIYFKLVIVNGWKERQFDVIFRAFSFTIAMLVGISLAILGVPYYAPTPLGCYFLPFPIGKNIKTTLGVVLFPFYIGVANMVILCWVYCHVQSQQRQTRRYQEVMTCSSNSTRGGLSSTIAGSFLASLQNSISRGARNEQRQRRQQSCCASCCRGGALKFNGKLEAKVFSRCFWYILTSFLIWIPCNVAYLYPDASDKYILWATFALVTPISGFVNALIYFRRWLFACKRRQTSAAAANATARGRSEGGNYRRADIWRSRETLRQENPPNADQPGLPNARRVSSSSVASSIIIMVRQDPVIADLLARDDHQDSYPTALPSAMAAAAAREGQLEVEPTPPRTASVMMQQPDLHRDETQSWKNPAAVSSSLSSTASASKPGSSSSSSCSLHSMDCRPHSVDGWFDHPHETGVLHQDDVERPSQIRITVKTPKSARKKQRS